MMTRDKFKDLLYKAQETNEFYDKVQELGIDLINCKYFEIAGIFFDELMKSEFGESGLDRISWWLYEDVNHVIYDGNDGEKVIADLNNIDDLYDYLTEGGRDAANE
jgi:hypothetical protein